jgi:tryptophan 6-halogenase
MPKVAKKIVIVGGGSGGWMTAAYLKTYFREKVDITLIESPNIATVGVGEATFSTINLFFAFLGLKEHEWMPSCGASYKMAIKFRNWNAEGRDFFHPFQRYERASGYHAGEWWLKLRDDPCFSGVVREPDRFDYCSFVIPRLCDLQLAPRAMDGSVFDPSVDGNDLADGDALLLDDLKFQFPYAFHFDAAKFALFLTGFAQERGVKQVKDSVINVPLAADGSIEHIVTEHNGEFAGDLYIDCTGFRGLLINGALNEPFISFRPQLLCDRAVAIQIPRDNEKYGMNPFTEAAALEAGWAWTIPLQGRDGTGYVYCSDFLSADEAEARLRQHIGDMKGDLPANHIRMRIGRNERSWVKNCVAIGLSSGFVEPLESTGIFFIQHSIEQLVSHWPGDAMDETMVASYNNAVAEVIDGVRDFLTLHYYASTRSDTPFWQAVKELKLPDDLRQRLELWKRRLPNARNINPSYHGFEDYSYSVMLMGLGYLPQANLPTLDSVENEAAMQMFRDIRRRTDELVRTLPTQYDYLRTQTAAAAMQSAA